MPSGKVITWNAAEWSKRAEFQSSELLLALTFSPDGRYLAIGDVKGRISLWNAEAGALCAQWTAHQASVGSLAFPIDSNQLISCGLDSEIRVWKLDAVRKSLKPLELDW